MNLDSPLPGRSCENGIELFSHTNALDLIRGWLPEAPDNVRIVRVSHRRFADEDIFTVSCAFEPAKAVETEKDFFRVFRLWKKHTEKLGLPAVTWVAGREIQLNWYPQGLEAKTLAEVPAAERVEFDFLYEAEHAVSIWKLLRGGGLASLTPHFGGFDECFTNIGDLRPPILSFKGRELTQHDLELSILDAPDIWFYVLTKASCERIASPLLPEFALACLRLRESGTIPNLSRLASAWEKDTDAFEPMALTPKVRSLSSDMVALAEAVLDELLGTKLQQVNALIRLTEQAEPEGDHPPDFLTNLPDPD